MKRSADNGNIDSKFCVGCFYHFGFYIKKEIDNAIKYYRQASSFNFQYAKNNLGMIYKHGFENQIKKNLEWAIVYFEEAINQKNDYISMYNLAHLHFYEEPLKDSFEKSIHLLVKSAKSKFQPSIILLCLVLIMTFGIDFNDIIKELKKYENVSNELQHSICYTIKIMQLDTIESFEYYYNAYHDIDYIYDFDFSPKIYMNKLNEKHTDSAENRICKNIDSNFYEGFGIDQ